MVAIAAPYGLWNKLGLYLWPRENPAPEGGTDLADFAKAQLEAERLIDKYGLVTPPVDPEAIAEAEGVEVVYVTFNGPLNESISGYIDPMNKRIVVNRDQPPARKTFTIAHELGHHLLHRAYTESGEYQIFPRRNEYPNGKPEEEREADAFAANLLVPMKMLRRYRDFASPYELSKMFLVSQDVILHRLKRA